MNKPTLLTAVLSLLAGLAAGYALFGQQVPTTPGSDTGQEAASPAKPVFYRNPMNPAITSPVPAKDHMGMDYIPVYADSRQEEVTGTVRIDPTVQQNMGVRIATAERTAISRTIRAVGRVDYNEENIVHLHPRVEGWIEEIWIDKTGQPVAYDDILLSIYSPKLVATQQEYLLALKNQKALAMSSITDMREGAGDLARSARERLTLLDVAEHQIKELEASGKIKESLHIHAPAGGTVLRIGARQGQHVTPATELYMIVDLSTVWVYADVYDYELPWVKTGDKVQMTLTSAPGRVFEGELAYIYPYAESKTRTTRIRIVFANPELLLRPEMFSEIVIEADSQPDSVVIPAEAVIRSGNSNQVFVVKSPGKFEPRSVHLGVESGGKVAVLQGLRAGEQVVTSAQFLIDSESKLREATAKMLAPAQSEPGVLRHD